MESRFLFRSASLIALALGLTAMNGCAWLRPAPRQRTIPVAEYQDKMKGGWLGQIIGVVWGAPVEFRYCDRIMPAEDMPEWTPDMINNAFGQDDLYVEMTFLRSLEMYGANVSLHQAGVDWANSKYGLAHANFAGRSNLRMGIAPPDSGHPQFNEHADDIDYQIEADYSGLIAPGMPNAVIALGDKFGRFMNYGDGVYGGQFVGGMYAEAFFENDIEKIIEAGLACIPQDCQYHECISDVLAWHRQNPSDWPATWALIKAKYQDDPAYRRGSCNLDSWKEKGDAFNIDAKINGAYIVMGLLYGDGDIAKTALIAAQCGQDSDCNPSNAVGILGTIYGFTALPDQYKQIDETKEFSFTAYNVPKLINVCDSLARQFVMDAGGSVVTDWRGREVYRIPVQTPKLGPLEECWNPGPIANSRFTAAEMDKIIQGNAIDLGPYDKIWTIHACGFDMAPGYYEELDGHKGVLVTHPFEQGIACSLKRTLAIPAGKKTHLHLVVGHHERGDWDLIVKVNAPDGYCTVDVDLSDHAGQAVDLELVNQPSGWMCEAAYWDTIEIVSE